MIDKGMQEPINKMIEAKEFDHFTFPGGYPLWYLTEDNGVLCAKCANANFELCIGNDPQWKIVAVEANYESDLVCDNCYEKIEAAYEGEEPEKEVD
jgi:hypothetical protein